MAKLTISNLQVSIEDKEILKGLSLSINSGEIHALMGPNGSGKSTLSYALMGHPFYQVKSSPAKRDKVQSSIKIDKTNIVDLGPDKRAKLGMFLAFQNPLTVAGVPVASFLRTAYQSIYGKDKQSIAEFNRMLIKKAEEMGLDRSFLRRSLNEGFSGGEKKKAEMLQAFILKPKFAIFDEIDTGLDVDALKTVAGGIRKLADQGTGVLIITHYQRILSHMKPDFVHIIKNGVIIKSGDSKLAETIEKEGYKSFV